MTELELLYEAINSPLGIEIEFHGAFQVIMGRLYTARRSDPDLEMLQFCRSPDKPENYLWIVKNPNKVSAQAPTLKQNPKGDGELFSLADLFGDE